MWTRSTQNQVPQLPPAAAQVHTRTQPLPGGGGEPAVGEGGGGEVFIYLFVPTSAKRASGEGAGAWPWGPQEPRAAGEGPCHPGWPAGFQACLYPVLNPGLRPLSSSSPKPQWGLEQGRIRRSWGWERFGGQRRGVPSYIWSVVPCGVSRKIPPGGDPFPGSPLLSFTCSPPLALGISGLWSVVPHHTHTLPVNQWAPVGA